MTLYLILVIFILIDFLQTTKTSQKRDFYPVEFCEKMWFLLFFEKNEIIFVRIKICYTFVAQWWNNKTYGGGTLLINKWEENLYVKNIKKGLSHDKPFSIL